MTHIAVLRRLSRSVAALLEAGENPLLHASIVKDLGATLEQEIPEIARQLVDDGQYASKGQPIFQLVPRISNPMIEARFSYRQFDEVKPGTRVNFQIAGEDEVRTGQIVGSSSLNSEDLAADIRVQIKPDGALPAELAGPGPIRVVHFWDPGCPCNVGNQQHLAELVARFAPRGVVFYAVQKPGSRGHLPAGLSTLQALDGLPGAERLPASPAVGIWDGEGRLAYFGPYSEGAVCNSANSFIEPVLEALAAGRPVSAANTLASGCFCAWH
nr:hypothetical protein [Gammaproteobacteria bacterium]